MFGKLHSALASVMTGLRVPVDTPLPVTALRIGARKLLDAATASIDGGDWKVDGAADPDSVMHRLEAVLSSHASETEVADRTLDLVDAAIAAITPGDWSIGGDALEAVIEASVLATPLASANDDSTRPAVAA